MGYIKNWMLAVLGAILLNVAASTPAFAQAANKASQGMLASRVEIPNEVLPKGAYIFRVSGSPSGRHTVRTYGRVTDNFVATRKTVPQFRDSFPPQPSIVFEQHGEPNRPVTTWFHLESKNGGEICLFDPRTREVLRSRGTAGLLLAGLAKQTVPAVIVVSSSGEC